MASGQSDQLDENVYMLEGVIGEGMRLHEMEG